MYRAHAKAGADLFDKRWLDEICIITAALTSGLGISGQRVAVLFSDTAIHNLSLGKQRM